MNYGSYWGKDVLLSASAGVCGQSSVHGRVEARRMYSASPSQPAADSDGQNSQHPRDSNGQLRVLRKISTES